MPSTLIVKKKKMHSYEVKPQFVEKNRTVEVNLKLLLTPDTSLNVFVRCQEYTFYNTNNMNNNLFSSVASWSVSSRF